MDGLLVAVVVAALAFDYTNGFHDAANAVATSISTRAVPPNLALLGAAVLNVVGALVSTHVAATLAKGIVEPAAVTPPVMLGGLLGAIVWNLLTWWWALPSSSSHCLIGGIVGAVLVSAGPEQVQWNGIVGKVLLPTVAAPLVGFTMGVALMFAAALDLPERPSRTPDAALPPGAARLGFLHGLQPRLERRPEDDGRDHPRALRRRACSRPWRSRSG